MNQKEMERRLRRALGFPREWFSPGLMPPQLMRQQLSSLRRHFGARSRPVHGAEHWRYGAFRFLLKGAKDEAALVAMLSVAYADPDELLGEQMVKDIHQHPLASPALKSSNKPLKNDARKNARAS
jgi:hypothetical protein